LPGTKVLAGPFDGLRQGRVLVSQVGLKRPSSPEGLELAWKIAETEIDAKSAFGDITRL
jgi:hypothetical protein